MESKFQFPLYFEGNSNSQKVVAIFPFAIVDLTVRIVRAIGIVGLLNFMIIAFPVEFKTSAGKIEAKYFLIKLVIFIFKVWNSFIIEKVCFTFENFDFAYSIKEFVYFNMSFEDSDLVFIDFKSAFEHFKQGSTNFKFHFEYFKESFIDFSFAFKNSNFAFKDLDLPFEYFN